MVAPSAVVTVNSQTISQTGTSGINVSAGSTITVALVSNAGVNNWTIQCTNADDLTSVASINETLTQTGFSATFVVPALDGYRGSAMQFTSTVNSGAFNQGVFTFGVFVLNSNNSLRLFFGGETEESNATVGNAADLNKLVIAAGTTSSTNFSAGGDLSGTPTSQTVIRIQGTAVSSTPPTTNQVLEYNGAVWTPTSSSSSVTWSGDLAGSNSSAQYVAALSGAGDDNTAIPINTSSLIWASGISAPSLSQSAAGTNATPQNLVLGAQAPGASSTGSTYGTPGNVIAKLAAPVDVGNQAFFEVQRGSNVLAQLGNASTGSNGYLWLGLNGGAPGLTNYVLSGEGGTTSLNAAAGEYIVFGNGDSSIEALLNPTSDSGVYPGFAITAGPSGARVGFGPTVTTPVLGQDVRNGDSSTNVLYVRAQSAYTSASSNTSGGALNLQGGAATSNGTTGLRGPVRLQVGADNSSGTLVEATEVVLGQRVVSLAQVGPGISTTQMPSGTGDGVVFLAFAQTNPSVAPVGGSILYTNASDGYIYEYTSNGQNILLGGGGGGTSVTWANDLSGSTSSHQYVGAISGTNNAQTTATLNVYDLQFNATINSGNQVKITQAGQAGDAYELLIQAQNSSGATGGELTLFSGTGATGTQAGSVYLGDQGGLTLLALEPSTGYGVLDLSTSFFVNINSDLALKIDSSYVYLPYLAGNGDGYVGVNNAGELSFRAGTGGGGSPLPGLTPGVLTNNGSTAMWTSGSQAQLMVWNSGLPVFLTVDGMLEAGVSEGQIDFSITPGGLYNTLITVMEGESYVTQWCAFGGDVAPTITPGYLTVVGLQGHSVSTASPSLNQVLTWNGAQWIPQAASGSSGLNLQNAGVPVSGGPFTTLDATNSAMSFVNQGSGVATLNANFWNLGGNFAPTPNTLGTTTATGLSLITNNTAALTITAGQLVGIGTTSSGPQLEVVAGSNTGLYVTSASGTGIYAQSSSGSGTAIWASSNGVGALIQNSSSTYATLQVEGSYTYTSTAIYASVGGNNDLPNKFVDCYTSNGELGYLGGNVSTFGAHAISDRKLKENIVDTKTGLETLLKIKVRDFNFKTNKDMKMQGFIAQELYKVFPNAVDKGDAKKLWTVNKDNLVPLLVKSVQELSAENKELKKCLSSLEKRMAKLEKK